MKVTTYLGDGVPPRAKARCHACKEPLFVGQRVFNTDCDYRAIAQLFCRPSCYAKHHPHDPAAIAAAAEQPPAPPAHRGEGDEIW